MKRKSRFMGLLFALISAQTFAQNEEILDIELDGKAVTKPDPRKERFNVIDKAFKQNIEPLQSRRL